MIIKILLIAGAIAFGFLFVRRPGAGGHLALRRVLGLMVVVGGIFAVLFPEAVTAVANAVGVGRGTDLVLYVLVMVFLFTSVSLYQRISTLDEQITQLTRHLALLTAREDPVDQKPGHE
jgi:small membrane protein